MTRRSGGALVVGALGLVALLGPGGCEAHPPRTERRGPILSIMQGEGEWAGESRAALAPGSVALALGGLPPGEVRRLGEALAQVADEALRRAAPDLLDLEDTGEQGAAPDPLHGALADLPALTAAANVLGSPWRAPGISVRLGATCAPAAARCTPLFAASLGPEDGLLRRGRALAWALRSAGILGVAADVRPALLRALREEQVRPASTLALVFGAPRGMLDEAELGGLRLQARQALKGLAADAPQRSWLEAIGEAPAAWELPIALAPEEVLVVPRLSALARMPEFVSEVQRAGTFAWVVRPR